MKKLALAFSIGMMTLGASFAFAEDATLTAEKKYMIGDEGNAVPFRPSPKVSILLYLDKGQRTVGEVAGDDAENTEWAAISYHKSAVNNKKGQAYWSSFDEPSIYYTQDSSDGLGEPDAPGDTDPIDGWKPIGVKLD